MATVTSRKRRGADTQRLVAAYFAANGWPYATDAGAGRDGVDILGVAGLSIEVKARNEMNPGRWIREAESRPGLPLVVFRPNGVGPASVGSWPVLMRLSDVVEMLRAAGYGDAPTDGIDRNGDSNG